MPGASTEPATGAAAAGSQTNKTRTGNLSGLSGHDCKARKLVDLTPGTVVRVQHHLTKRWDLIGKIMEVKLRGRSYLVR